MNNINKNPKGNAFISSPQVPVETEKLNIGEKANVGDFGEVRTTVISSREGRLKTDVGATPKRKILKKALKKFK